MAMNFRGDACYVEVRVIPTRFVSPIVGSLIENTSMRFAGLEKYEYMIFQVSHVDKWQIDDDNS